MVKIDNIVFRIIAILFVIQISKQQLDNEDVEFLENMRINLKDGFDSIYDSIDEHQYLLPNDPNVQNSLIEFAEIVFDTIDLLDVPPYVKRTLDDAVRAAKSIHMVGKMGNEFEGDIKTFLYESLKKIELGLLDLIDEFQIAPENMMSQALDIYNAINIALKKLKRGLTSFSYDAE